MNQERLKILHLISEGVICADEGLLLLDTLSATSDDEQGNTILGPVLSTPLTPSPLVPHSSKPPWAAYWPAIFGLGIFVATIGGVYSFMALFGQLYWGWAFLTAPLLTIGVGISLFGWLMVTSAWLRVKVKDNDTNINLSFPIPLHWLAKLVQVVRPWIPQLRTVVTDDILEIIVASIQEADFNIEVHEASGEHVLVSYG